MRDPYHHSPALDATARRGHVYASCFLAAAIAVSAAGACARAAPRGDRPPDSHGAAAGPAGSEAAAVEAPEPATVVLLVRHAEKAGPTGDVPLNAAGERRARSLAAALADAGVQAIITTQFQRTRQTAAPLAAARGLAPEVVSAGGSASAHAEQVAAAVRERHRGQVVLVVGHSNTVPSVVAALGGPRMADLCDAEYSSLFVLVLDPSRAAGAGAPARLVRGKYGAPDESATACGTGAMQPR